MGHSSTVRNVAAIPWSALALHEGSAGMQPLFAGATHAHMALKWVFRHHVRWQICRHGEAKGKWSRDTTHGGTGCPPLSEPMSPVPDANSVGSLSLLNLCGDSSWRPVMNFTLPCCRAKFGHVGMVQVVARNKEC